MKKLKLNFHLLLPYVVLLWELYSNAISEKAKGGCDQFPVHFNQPMHWWHGIGVGSLAETGWVNWGGNGWATNLPCFHHGGEEFLIFQLYFFTLEAMLTKTSGRTTLTKKTWQKIKGELFAARKLRYDSRTDTRCKLSVNYISLH